jgi:hypothetical protein
MLSRTMRCWNRLNDWNTMPISLRIRSMFLMSSISSIPSMTIRPRSWLSRRLIVRMNVDLPEPDGPTITTTSPRRTVVEMPLSAWKAPNHFSTSSHDHRLAVRRLAHRSPTPSHVSTRWLHRDIEDAITQNRKAAGGRASAWCPMNSKSWDARLAVDSRSENDRAASSDVSLNTLMKWPIIGGIVLRNAWGRATRIMVRVVDRPNAFAASYCRSGTPCRPPRTISAA